MVGCQRGRLEVRSADDSSSGPRASGRRRQGALRTEEHGGHQRLGLVGLALGLGGSHRPAEADDPHRHRRDQEVPVVDLAVDDARVVQPGERRPQGAGVALGADPRCLGIGVRCASRRLSRDVAGTPVEPPARVQHQHRAAGLGLPGGHHPVGRRTGLGGQQGEERLARPAGAARG